MATFRLLALLGLFNASWLMANEEIPVGDFANDGLLHWKERTFEGPTEYAITEYQGQKALTATTSGGATALLRAQKLNISSTPFLAWEWQTESVFSDADPSTKAGDDYPARVYVVVRTGPFPWQIRAINYVWGNSRMPSQWWSSPYTDKSAMIPLQRSPSAAWQAERVDVVADFKRVFNLDVTDIDGVAIMTDGDNGNRSAIAHYRRLRFTN